MGQTPIESKIYQWQKPSDKAGQYILSTILFEGQADAMEHLQMRGNTLLKSSDRTTVRVPSNEEHLIIIKAGELSLEIKDSTWNIGPGSIALLMPSETYSLQSTGKSCDYYLMSYRSGDPDKKAGSSFVKDIKKIPFKPHDKGGIRNYFDRPTAMSKRFEMHATTLKEGPKSHEPHTHKAEEIVLITHNKTEMQIGDKFFKGEPGDIYYLGSNVPHAIRNVGKGECTYFAFQF